MDEVSEHVGECGVGHYGKTFEDIYTDDAIRDLGDSGIEVPHKEDFTCNTCGDNKTCDLAWDLYNTNEDCLAEK